MENPNEISSNLTLKQSMVSSRVTLKHASPFLPHTVLLFHEIDSSPIQADMIDRSRYLRTILCVPPELCVCVCVCEMRRAMFSQGDSPPPIHSLHTPITSTTRYSTSLLWIARRCLKRENESSSPSCLLSHRLRSGRSAGRAGPCG